MKILADREVGRLRGLGAEVILGEVDIPILTKNDTSGRRESVIQGAKTLDE